MNKIFRYEKDLVDTFRKIHSSRRNSVKFLVNRLVLRYLCVLRIRDCCQRRSYLSVWV